jgi:hypothetical protein
MSSRRRWLRLHKVSLYLLMAALLGLLVLPASWPTVQTTLAFAAVLIGFPHLLAQGVLTFCPHCKTRLITAKWQTIRTDVCGNCNGAFA